MLLIKKKIKRKKYVGVNQRKFSKFRGNYLMTYVRVYYKRMYEFYFIPNELIVLNHINNMNNYK